MGGMMSEGMVGGGMMWGMGIAHLLLLLVIVLAVAALASGHVLSLAPSLAPNADCSEQKRTPEDSEGY
jgi:hypothetical protein